MDPVTHAVVARMAASIRRGPLSRAGAAPAAVGGLAPDLDVVLVPVGWDVYLRVHEAGTHSLAGGALLAAGLAAAARRVSADDFRSLYVTALLAVLSPILLDVISGATIRLGWPLLPGRSAAAFWSDLRFCFAPHPDEGPFPGSPLRPGVDPIAGGVWFGGEIDDDGRVVRQFVRVGDYVQER